MTDEQLLARNALRAEILAEVAEEQIIAWSAEKESEAKLKNKRLNHELARPDAVAPWNNMAPENAAPMPGIAEILGYEFRNELGDAELFQKMQGGRYAYDHAAGKWMEFGGVIWEMDAVANARRTAMTTLPEVYEHGAAFFKNAYEKEKDKIEKRKSDVKHALEKAQVEKNEDAVKELKERELEIAKDFAQFEKNNGAKKKAMRERARQLRGSKRIGAVLQTAASGKSSLGVSGEEWEKHPNLFAVANGVVDLETGRLIRSSPGLYLQKASQYPYIGLTAFSNWWNDHLRKIFCNNEELIEYFEWAIGYSVTGTRFNKDIWVAYGPQADNGKSATFNTIKDVVGGYATTIKVDLLLDDGSPSKGPDPDLMVIDGLRMGVASEAGEKAKFSIERIKAITGGDDVRARGLFADSKIIESMVKLWLHTNSIPNLSGYDPGFKLRLKVVPFTAKFTMREEDVNPGANVFRAMDQHAFKLLQKQEAPYVLSWILRCARKFYSNPHYKPPDVVMQYTSEYFDDQDLVGQFVTACCVLDPGAKTQAKDLYQSFCRYCKEELGIVEKYIMSQRNFGTDLAKRFDKHESNKVFYKGIALQPKWETKSDTPMPPDDALGL